MIYGSRSNGNPHGLVLTKPFVVEFMLDRVGYTSDRDLRDIRVIEPAAGDGAFGSEIIKRLFASAINFGFSFQKALTNITLFEIDTPTFLSLQKRIVSLLFSYSATLPEGLILNEDFLLHKASSCDVVIGNPPYVRHENIPEGAKNEYRKRFSTFRHRSDLYIAFYEKGLRLLKDDGVLSFICSNRWLKNQYGNSLRELVKLAYTLEEVVGLENTSPFEEEVTAYPAITTIRKGISGVKSKYYEISEINQLAEAGLNELEPRILNTRSSTNWFAYQSNSTYGQKHLDSIENQGFRIGIGVATGSDQVFIGKEFGGIIEDELLLPILLSRDLKNNQIRWSGNYVINPFDENGNLINLRSYPKATEYFEANRHLLEKRHVAKNNPSSWYKTIDKINSSLARQVKILLPDISGNSRLLIDNGNFYPHHNLYYITGNDQDRLIVLAAVLMSDFVMSQLLEIGNKMNGGYPRWQSQNLRKLRIPVIDAMPNEVVEMIKKAYQAHDLSTINKLISEKKIPEYSNSIGQTVLFDAESATYKSTEN